MEEVEGVCIDTGQDLYSYSQRNWPASYTDMYVVMS